MSKANSDTKAINIKISGKAPDGGIGNMFRGTQQVVSALELSDVEEIARSVATT